MTPVATIAITVLADGSTTFGIQQHNQLLSPKEVLNLAAAAIEGEKVDLILCPFHAPEQIEIPFFVSDEGGGP